MKFLILVLSFLFASTGFSAGKTYTDQIYGSDGGPVSAPGGITLPAASAQNGDVFYGTYAATLTAGTNVAAVVTPVTLKYFKLGTSACFYGQVSIDPTSSATASVFTLTLPTTRSANFSGTGGASGHAGILGAAVGSCLATDSAKTITCNYVSGGTAVELVPVSVCYATSGN